MNDKLLVAVEEKLCDQGLEVKIESCASTGGGSINEAYSLSTNEGPFFLKLNSNSWIKIDIMT